jgi:hypothetical protein
MSTAKGRNVLTIFTPVNNDSRRGKKYFKQTVFEVTISNA